jgi:RNA-directed DNA polymerase
MSENTGQKPLGGISSAEEQKAKELWTRVQAAGGMKGFIEARLKADGLALPQAPDKKKKDKAQKPSKEEKKRLDEQKAKNQKALQVRDNLWKEVLGAYRALHLVHLGDAVFFTESPAPDPAEPEERAERLTKREIPDYEGPTALAEAMGLTVSQLRWLCFKREVDTGTHYKTFTIPKKTPGSRRTIRAPLPLLKKAQRWILREILEKLPVHGAAQGFVAGASTLTNAIPHAGSPVVVKIDVKDFFPTITLARVKGMFRSAGFREPVAIALASLCTEPPRDAVKVGGKLYHVATGSSVLPQGAPTSPYITNILCRRLDRRLRGWCAKAGWRYTRYADDLTFSWAAGGEDPGRGKVEALITRVREVLRGEGFTVNEEKTLVMRRGRKQRVTGLVVNALSQGGEAKPRAPREFRRKLRAALHRKELEAQVGLAGVKSTKVKQSALDYDHLGLATLQGMAAYVAMANYDEGEPLLKRVGALREAESAASRREAGE